MRLAPLLASLSDHDLERLALEHVRTDEKLPRPQLCNFLEGALRSYRFVNDFITNRQPPTFAMLTLLLDAPGYQQQKDGFEGRVMAETRRLAELVDAEEIVARDDQLQLYRRALAEARRNDLDVNGSEAALLSLLRRETGIAQVEHFLIEHHRELRQFWEGDSCFGHEENALRSAGLLFVRDGCLVLPEDLVPAISQTLGIDMPVDAARRLLGYLSNAELATVLEAAGSRTSGTKEVRLERILLERIQPRVVLRSVGLGTLREICRATEASVGGNKDDLIERIVEHFAQRRDQRVEEPVEPPKQEPRQLDESRFRTLFSALTHQELSDILRRFPELRQSGTKEARIDTLWESHLAEQTLLGELMNRQLEDVLHRLGLRLSGSKGERVSRLLDHFGETRLEEEASGETSDARDAVALVVDVDPEVLSNQATFAQRSSSPQASLQPWLEELLNGPGLVRCYATEDPNPTKQLKNKLSQAASARGGMLVLLLVDESAFLKAREALLERWMSNDEWPKGVACVALAYPQASPAVRVVVEHVHSPLTERLRARVFPSVAVTAARRPAEQDGASEGPAECRACQASLPVGARFCPSCGSSVHIRSNQADH